MFVIESANPKLKLKLINEPYIQRINNLAKCKGHCISAKEKKRERDGLPWGARV
jgi:hypothetical protein